VAEVFQCADDRVGCTLTQATQAVGSNLLTQLFQQFDVPIFAFPGTDAVQDIEDPPGANTARGTFSTTLILCKFHEEAGNIHHAGFIIHDDHTTRTHHGSCCSKCFIINRQV